MASEITWSPNPIIPIDKNINDVLNMSISASQTGITPPNPLPSVEYVTVSLSKISSGITATDGNISSPAATISGQIFCDVFDHTAKYISCGSSDLIEAPLTNLIRHQDILDGDKEIFDFPTIITTDTTLTITATAHLSDSTTDSAVYIVNVTNDLSALKTWIEDYFANKPYPCP